MIMIMTTSTNCNPCRVDWLNNNKQGLDLGGNVNLDEGWPLYYLGNNFHECLPPDYAGKDYEPCTTIDKGPVSLEW